MAEEAASKEKPGARIPSIWNAFLDALFAVLNFVLSGPPGWQKRPQKPTQQQKPNWRMLFLWGASLGIILGIISACVYYFGFENDTPNLFNGRDGWLTYSLMLAPSFFLISLLRGRVTGSSEDGIRIALEEGISITIIACMIQAITALILMVVFSLVFSFWEWDHSGIVFALFGIDLTAGSFGYGISIVLLLCFQTPWAVLNAFIGGLIGSLFFYRRPK